jgi:arylsulfatase A-like enzyme
MSKNIYTGAIYGISAWLIYGIIEGVFSIILPWVIKPHYEYAQLHWGFTAIVFGIYSITGAFVGGTCGLLLSILIKRIAIFRNIKPYFFLQAAIIISIIVSFNANLISVAQLTHMSVLLSLIISLIITALLIAGVCSDLWHKRIGFISNPWSVTFLLVGLMWIIKDFVYNYSYAVKFLSAFGYIVAIFSISFLVYKIVFTRRIAGKVGDGYGRSWKSLMFVSITVFLLIGLNYFLRQTPIGNLESLKSYSQNNDHPNIILIIMDTVRADHLSLYGYERDTTPYLRKLAKEATLYTNSIASADMTLPTHASIFTGMYARRHGAHYDSWSGSPRGRPLSGKFHTLAEILSENGYATAGVVANIAFLTKTHNLSQGFQYYDYRSRNLFLGETSSYYLRNFLQKVLSKYAPTAASDLIYRRADEINSEVFTLIEKIKQDEAPFFFFINYMDAHEPYLPPPPFDSFYPGKMNEKFTRARYRSLEKSVMKLERNITEAERSHLISQYDGGISYIDFQLGQLITRLKKTGKYENSLIIITSDHGETFGERGLVGHGVSVYQDQIYVPLLIKYPHQSTGKEIDNLVSSVDLMPTILDMLGVEIPKDVQGTSIIGPDLNPSRFVMSESFPYDGWLDWHERFDRIERAIFSGSFKLICSTAGKREFYNLSEDSYEKINLYNDNALSKPLEKQLNQWLDTVNTESSSPAKLDKSAIDRLKSLGYVR